MTNVTFSVSKKIHEKMKAHPEIKWSEILRKSILKYLKKLENPGIVTMKDLREDFGDDILSDIDQLDTQKEIEYYKKVKELESTRTKRIENLMRG